MVANFFLVGLSSCNEQFIFLIFLVGLSITVKNENIHAIIYVTLDFVYFFNIV